MGLIKNIIRKITTKKYKPSPKELGGSPLLKPSEASARSGGYVSTKDPSIPATYGTTSTSDIKTTRDVASGGGGRSSGRGGGRSSGRGGGSSKSPTGSIQETLRDSEIQTREQGQLTKPTITTQQSLRDKTIERYNPQSRVYETSRRDPYGQGTREVDSTRLPTIKSFV